MKLYLVQHGKYEKNDGKKILSSDGKNETKKIAKHLSKRNLKLHNIFHSSKIRAQETAEIFGEFLKVEKNIEETNGLNPKDDPESLAEEINYCPEDSCDMLISHLPLLEEVTSILLGTHSKNNIIKFKNSAVLELEKHDNNWVINSYLRVEDI